MEEKQNLYDLEIETNFPNLAINSPKKQKEIFQTEANVKMKPITSSNISQKFNTKYKNEELNKFKDEILSFLKERDSYYHTKINTYHSHIELTEKKYENLTNVISSNYQQILTSQANLNNRLDKFNSYESFVLKTNDNLTSHEIRINNLREDFSKATQKYDKIYLDNLELPGYIGRCAKYKNCQLFFADVIKEINKFNNFKEKNNIDLKSYKEKLEQIIKTFKTLVDNNNKAQISYINKLNEKNFNECKNMVDILGERVTELRLENSKYSVELINKTNEVKEQINKVKEMKGEILRDFYNKIEEHKNITNNINKSFNEFKNEYAIIRKKFLEMAEFIKDIRFKKNLGVDVNKKEINNIYKNLIKKNKRSSEDKNVHLLNNTSEIEKMVFKENNNNINNNVINNIKKEMKKNKKHELYNSTNNLIDIRNENLLDSSEKKRKEFKENKRNFNSFYSCENNIKNKTVGLIDYILKDNELDVKDENNVFIDQDIKEENKLKEKILLMKENDISENEPNDKNKIIISDKDSNINNNILLYKDKDSNDKGLESKNINIIKDINENKNKEEIQNIIQKEINEKEQNYKNEEVKIDMINNKKIEKNNKNKNIRNEKNIKQSQLVTSDNLSITNSFSSCYNTNSIGGATTDRNFSNISIPISYNINNVKCNKFILNDICKSENDNKIIKELASELEQSSAKKIQKLVSQKKSDAEDLESKKIQNIEPINLINNIKPDDEGIMNNKKRIKNKSLSQEKNEISDLPKTLNKNENYSEDERAPKNGVNKLFNNYKLKSLIEQDIETNSINMNLDNNEISNLKNKKNENNEINENIENELDFKSNNTESNNENNYNFYIENTPESINRKLYLFNQKLFDIETYMKEKFLEIIKQIDSLRPKNTSKKFNQLNQYKTTGYKKEQNIFNTIYSENYNNYNLSGRDENFNNMNYHTIKFPKFDVYSQLISSDHMKSSKKCDCFKDTILFDNLNKIKKNEEMSVIKKFIEKTINVNNSKLFYKEYSKKKFNCLTKNKNLNFINNIMNFGNELNENNNLKMKNNSTINGNDIKWIDLKTLTNRKIPKNSSCQKLNPILSGENK